MKSLPLSLRSLLRHAAFALGLVAATGALAAAPPRTQTVKDCSWDQPGHNPFTGDVVAAVDRYQDIPADVRARLKARMEQRQYDEIVSIRRDSIEGRGVYDPVISQMHFGADQVCRNVTRSKWTPQMQERGLVYCDSGQCLLVPTVCRNVSRITRRAEPAAGGVAGGSAAPEQQAQGPLLFEPPAAGPAPEDGTAGPLGAGGGGGAGNPAGSSLPDGSPSVPLSVTPPGTFAQSSSPPGNTPLGGPPPLFNPPSFLSPSPPLPGVPIPAVPEPQTWAMMGLGLSLLGSVSVRRRRAAARGSAR